MPRYALIALMLVLVSGCADRFHEPIDPAAAEEGPVRTIFAGTTRAATDETPWSYERSDVLRFQSVDVARPPGRSAGAAAPALPWADPNRGYRLARVRDFPTGEDFVRSLGDALASRPRGQREVTVFVHGYNNTFSDAAFRLTQLMDALDVPGAGVIYAWPSRAHPFGYAYDRDSALFARDGLEDLLMTLEEAAPGQVLLIGHSMGSQLIMETLRQIEIRRPGWSRRALSGVVLLAPDIDVDIFRSQAARFAALPRPFVIFASRHDRALMLSARLFGEDNRLGNIESAEEVADLPVTILDVSAFSTGQIGHFVPGTSPALIALLRSSVDLDRVFARDRSVSPGLLPGTVIRAQNATQIILSPGILLAN